MRGVILIMALVISGMSAMLSMPDVFACLCDELTIEQRISHADVIFSGIMNDNTWNGKDTAASFDVRIVWKGADSFPLIKGGHVEVITPKAGTACGVNFIPEKGYLIYAAIDNKNLSTTTCDGSWFLDGRADDIQALDGLGSTHHFIDAREIKGSSSHDCKGPGPFTVEECEFEKLVRNIFLPVGIALPIIAVSVFFIWRVRR